MTTENTRLMDLLIQRATDGLAPEEVRELEALLAEQGQANSDDIDLAVAAVANAFAVAESSTPDAPEALKAKLGQDAAAFFDARDEEKVVDLESRRRSTKPAAPRSSGFSWLGSTGWAMAAMLLLVLLLGYLPSDPGGDTNQGPGTAPGAAPGLVERRAALESLEGSRVTAWATPQMPGFQQVTGDVVWNDERQEGYLRLSGLPANDPSAAQYQLWIVDPEVDEHPVDGGVFDMPANVDEAIIPIDAKLAVARPAAFAITLERPGGVVVSAGPLLVVASPG